ncbi:MAG: hypothetical protein K1X74_06970 [Pirellulales bacterium]|nr:hypothetical protein [Pirellulales bacterium]
MRLGAIALGALVFAAVAQAVPVSAAQPLSPAARAMARFRTPGSSSQTTDLKTTLEKGLRARKPEDFVFIARVVALVENKTLPVTLVQSTYAWASRKPRTPFPYFQQALRIRAKRIGVTL